MKNRLVQCLETFVVWLRGVDFLILVLSLTVVMGIWLFVALAMLIDQRQTQETEDRILQSLRRLDDPREPVGPSWLKEVARDVTALGSYSLVILLTVTVVGYLVLAKKHHAALLVVVATVGGWWLSSGLKLLFARSRPEVVPHLTVVATASFPSGHSMISAVVYLTLGALLARLVEQRSLKIYFLATAVVLTVLVGLTRVYLGVHYPTDVLAGWTAGLVWAIVCGLVARRLQQQHLVESPQ